MTEQFLIRSATKNDSNIISELSFQLGYPSSPEQIKKRLEDILNHPENIVLVATIAKKVVGWIHIFFAHRIESDSFAEIGGLVVDEKYRGKGIGKLLCVEAEKWSKKNRVKKLRVRSNIIRSKTHKFYFTLDYKEEKVQKVFGKILKRN